MVLFLAQILPLHVTPTAQAAQHSPSYARWFGPGLGLAALALYGSGLCRDLYWYDSAEYTAAAVTLGIPHPPGYPLYTLLAHAFTWLPLPAPLAVNLLSALAAAGAVTLAYACSRRLGTSVLGGATAAITLARAPALWRNALVAEVYAPALCFALGTLWLLLDDASQQPQPQPRAPQARTRKVWSAALLAGLGLGMHLSIATLGLCYLALSVGGSTPLTRPRHARRLAGAALCVLAGYLAAYSYIPLRAGAGGVPDHATPTTLARYLWLLSGGNYRGWFAAPEGSAALVGRLFHTLYRELGVIGSMLLLMGLLSIRRQHKSHVVALGLGVLGNLAFFASYRVDDLEVFLLPSVALLALVGGAGADRLSQSIAEAGKRPQLRVKASLVWVLLAAALIPIDHADHDLSGFHDATTYAARLERELPSRAVILDYTTPAEWKYAAVFAMYHQGVLGRRPDVIVARNLGPVSIGRLLQEGRAVYMFAPVEPLSPALEVRAEGALNRVVQLHAERWPAPTQR